MERLENLKHEKAPDPGTVLLRGAQHKSLETIVSMFNTALYFRTQ